MARSELHQIHRFNAWQVWPGSYDNPPLGKHYPFPECPGLDIDRTTPIASMGSCFAREIRKRLIGHGYNYIQEEGHHPASVHASAAWERTYNTFTMRQIFEYTFGSFEPDVRWWISPETTTVQDPFRRLILYDSLGEAKADFNRHLVHSRAALTKARVIILTLGLTEIWEDRLDKTVICLPSGPYVNEGGDMDRYRFRVSRYPENLGNLEAIYKILRDHNPGCKLLITVSPVHLWATFRTDLDVISASCNSKSTLRAVADEFVSNHEDVFYFPAYEMATIQWTVMGKSPFEGGKENFHIKDEAVDHIMEQFFNFYTRK
ncbi:MAG: GSCFA domain-containing protein [Desulfobacterium sp.]|nr:GSCFA domain-containing protein [Desulfobacterium sp.]